jgi:hypothetical protein
MGVICLWNENRVSNLIYSLFRNVCFLLSVYVLRVP